MKLKTSNKLLLGYGSSLLVLIGGFLIFGFTNVKNLPENRFTANAEINSEAMDEFSVLHISGNANLHMDQGHAFEIIRTTYPNDAGAVNINYSIRNDTCFVTQWERKGMNHAVLKVRNIETVIVESSNKLTINDFAQDRLKVFLYAGKLETSQKMFKVDQFELTAAEGANARLQGINKLQLNAENSQIQVYSYLVSVSGEIKQGSHLQLHKSVGKLNLEKSRDSRLISY
jgi:hypothetical protein